MPDQIEQPSAFERALAASAIGQYDAFHMFSESDPQLAAQIKKYWNQLHAIPGCEVMGFPGVGEAWSAVFVSWNVFKAHATLQEFRFGQLHSRFVHFFMHNPGIYAARRIGQYAPRVGDIIQNNRGNNFDFDFAASHDQYPSHTAIVVAKGVDHQGKFVTTIGGNESDSIRKKRVKLNANGTIQQRANDPYICVLECRK